MAKLSQCHHQKCRRGRTVDSLEESQLVFVVGDEHVLGVSVTIQHHLVALPAEARLLVSSERSVRWIGLRGIIAES